VLAICTVATAARVRRDLMLASVTVVPLLAIVAGFSLWQGPLDSYYCLPLAPCVALTIALALTMWQPSARLVSVALALCVLVVQPSRRAYSMTLHRLPEYRALVSGSREIRRRVADVQGIAADFPLPPTTDPEFLYRILGGRISPDARYHAVIALQGHVRFDVVGPFYEPVSRMRPASEP
jgi:hypothetical protein